MKQNLFADYLSCILFRSVSFFTSFLPLNLSLFFGRRLGELIYLFDKKHRLIAYANIRHAFKKELNYRKCKEITRLAYRAFGQNLIEISFVGRINKQYLKKYIDIKNKESIDAAFKRGKGVIFLAVHEGNWELSNIICANLGFPFTLFVRDQAFVKLNALLNSYRLKNGAKIIHKKAGVRQLIEVLKSNQAIGLTADQGGRGGQIVKFFGKEASMSTGAVKLALKYDCSIIPVFYTRIKGPYTSVILDRVYTVSRSVRPENDVKENLQRLMNIFENYIRRYPHEYLWTYKIWKYGKERDILILSDGSTGHLRQSEGAVQLINQVLTKRQIKASLFIKEVKFRPGLSKFIFNLFGCGINGLRNALTDKSWHDLMSLKPDIIVSAGTSISKLCYFLAKENQAKSICLMRPANCSIKKFNLAIIPEHDRPVKRKNVVATEGALNLISSEYLAQRSRGLEQSGLIKGPVFNPCIGVLIGGNSKSFFISPKTIAELCGQIKKAAELLNAGIFISTSRRTSLEIEEQIKNEFINYPRSKLLVIANQNNHPDAVGGILGLSDIIISSPESISMISEATKAGKYVLVFDENGLSKRHRFFLKNYQNKGYIYLKQADELADSINWLWQKRPKVNFPKDNLKVIEALDKIL
ncbi:MAG: ELM1/GtrOC1 family putative glycosyltransferase [Candidatus Omnitrophica bacterium]|nr:ELM1/GtrOC1 family putative glycosyltransferase [Candidatus Omnitrophota bacterium]